MNIKPIKNELDYEAALKRIDLIWDALPGTARGNEFEILSILIEHYEQEHYAIAPPDPIDAIKFRMEQMGMKKTDLAALVGGRSRSTEILNRNRTLSVRMMRNLHTQLNIPAECLLVAPSRRKAGKAAVARLSGKSKQKFRSSVASKVPGKIPARKS